MGNSLSPEDHLSFLHDNYRIVGEESKLKILEDKETLYHYALLEQCFANRMEFDRNFKKLTNRSTHECQNILQMVKMWSKEHSGICSNLFKIYTVYQYPKVKLIDEIEARQGENKMFEEIQLFSILQSCIHAVNYDPSYVNLSPNLVFIMPEGMIKVIHRDLMDSNFRNMYNEGYYYSPEKIVRFQREEQSQEEIQKETVFSLGMTILHSALLASPGQCYEISMKKFNHKTLEILLERIKMHYSGTFFQMMANMLTINPSDRYTLEQTQNVVNQYFANSTSMFGSKQSRCTESIKLATHQPVKVGDFSLVYSGDTFCNRVSDEPLGVCDMNRRESQLDFRLTQSKQTDMPRNPHILQKSNKGRSSFKIDKENVFTDPKLIEMIRSGIQKITSNQSSTKSINGNMIQSKVSPLGPMIQSQTYQDPFSEYQLKTESKEKCMFVVQNYEDGTHFEGMQQFGMKNGYGRLVYPDGVYYQGNFKNDTLEGKGSLFYGKERPAYVGDWVNNKFHGKGTLYNEYPVPLYQGFDFKDFNVLGDCWVKYEGDFVEDIKQGEGRIVLTNGEVLEGMFEKGLLNGNCAFVTMGEGRIEGRWEHNLMIVE